MNKKSKILISIVSIAVLGLIISYLHDRNFAVLDPAGLIAGKEKNLITLTLLLSLVVVVPVFFMTFWFAFKYRESNHNAHYRPDWDHSVIAETIWWAVPSILILVLAGITWQSSHELDPFKPISAQGKPLTVQVIALDWKWLFIYPDQKVASVNYVNLPVNRPIDFEITADAPMNSFWIPQLGGQIYAMSGMSTHLHLVAAKEGVYKGASANLSGRGFAGMQFNANVSSESKFRQWIGQAGRSTSKLDLAAYSRLSLPSENNPQVTYSQADPNLYNTIVSKYLSPLAASQYVDQPTEGRL